MASLDASSITHLHTLLREMVLERLRRLSLDRITLDFDGSVIGTGKYAEGSAFGFNRKKKANAAITSCFVLSPNSARS